MQILIIPSWYPSPKNPLSGSFFREQAMALADAGHDVTVLNATLQDRYNYFSSDNFKLIKRMDGKLRVYLYTMPSFGAVRNSSLFYAIFKRNMFKVFKKMYNDGLNFDIIHAHSFLPAGIAACDLGERNSIPVVITEHSSGVLQKDLNKKQIAFLKSTVERADTTICVSPALKTSILALTKTEKEISVIPNMVSPLFVCDEVERRNKEFVFVSIASLIERKRIRLTIQAFCDAFQNEQNVKLYLIGDGPLITSLKHLVTDLNMEKQIKLLGRLSRLRTAEEVKNSDAFVLASVNEPFGVVYIEALACGKPVIGSRNGGAEFIINSSNGLLVDVDNREQLAKAMKYLYDNINGYDRKKISADCIATYSGEAIVRELTDIYMKLLERNEQK